MRKCILCNTNDELRGQIEDFVAGGGNYKEASLLAKKIGLQISHTSVQRHIETHTDIEYTYAEKVSNEQSGSLLLERIESVEFDDKDEFEAHLNTKLRKMLGNLANICDSRLQSYMLGETRFPKDEFRILHSTYALLLIFSITKRKVNDGCVFILWG